MSTKKATRKSRSRTHSSPPSVNRLTSDATIKPLLDAMIDGEEYSSIVGVMPPAGMNLVDELKKALCDIEAVRGRPCIAYVGNVVNGKSDSSVITKDDLPFVEMVQAVDPSHRKVDVFLATQGGSGSQIARFVNCLRSRFDEVDFLIPSFCMSAGTLFALSGNKIWMNPQACLGPIDPQVPNAQGRYVPAQALLLLIEKLQTLGNDALLVGQNIPWTAVRIIDTMDKKDLGDAISATGYSTSLATEFLINYKFRDWTTRSSSQQAVTQEYRGTRAKDIATALASHERWKSHGHALSREILWTTVQLAIDHPDHALERVIRRAWALCYWLFDKMPIQKIIVSPNYGYLTFETEKGSG